jgi:hypothetical protein
MATENVGIFIDSKADLKGFKQAETAAAQLNKSVKMLATTLGVGYGARAIVNFGKTALKAFSEDEAAARRLATAVDNLGLSLSKTKVEDFIKQTETSSGILDDHLRPAMQALLTTTGSLTKSQELLNDAIQISRASGVDLATVSQDLANGYVGITKGLKKYNTGLTQAELKSKSFNEILGVMLTKSAGAANDYLTTTAYKMDVLNVAAANAQETIGAGLVDAFARIAGGSEAKDAAKAIDNIAKAVSNVVIAIGTVIGAIEKFRKGYTNLLAGGDVSTMLTPKTSTNRSSSPAGTYARTQQQRVAEAAAAKRAKALLNAQKANTAELKKQAALKKAGTVFDMDQIQLIAALKGKLSDEERLRVQAMLAILNENDVLASQLTKQILMAQDATGGLYKYFLTIGNTKINNPFAFLDQWILDFQKKLNDLFKTPTAKQPDTYVPAGLDPALAAIGVVAGYGDYSGSTANPYSNEILNGLYGMQTGGGDIPDTTDIPSTNVPEGSGSWNGWSSGISNLGSAPVINVTVQGNIIKEQDLIQQIQNGTQLASLSGSPSQIGRIAGMFS